MNILSLFDGISCGQIALEKAGIQVDNYFASEIDKYAVQVTQYNYPNTIQLGDVRNVKYENGVLYSDNGEYKVKIDLLIGGSPCQGFSFAGKQLNFDDPRSRLFFDFVRLKNETQPKFFMLENVRMKKEHENVISQYLGVKPVMINSALVSAQNRVRLYWCNWDVDDIEDKGIFWGDVKEIGVNIESFYYSKKAMQWLARHSIRKNKTLKIYNNDEKMQMLEVGHAKKYSSQRFFAILDIPESEETIASIRNRRIKDLVRKDYDTTIKPESYIEFKYDGKSNCLSTIMKDNVVVPFTLPNRISIDEFYFRYITPIECERLQTVPDNYTNVVSNTQRYRQLGNGWTVDVIVELFRSMVKNGVSFEKKYVYQKSLLD